MTVKVMNKWGIATKPITTDALIMASFGTLLERIVDEANKALNRLDEQIEAIRRNPQYSMEGKEGASVDAAKQTISELNIATVNQRRAIDEAVTRAKSEIPTKFELPRPDNVWIGGDARIVEQRANEIRQVLGNLDESERSIAFVVGARSQDHELVWAVIAAPPTVRNSMFPDVSAVDNVINQYIARRYPEKYATVETATNAKFIADGIITQAVMTAKTLTNAPTRFDGISPEDAMRLVSESARRLPVSV